MSSSFRAAASLRAYVDSDFEAISGWHIAHGKWPIDRDDLPPLGFIEDGVAVGFLIRTDSSMAFVHYCITNPNAPISKRHAAMHAIIEACVDAAKAFGFKYVLTWSGNKGAVRRAVQHGGKVIETAQIVARRV